MINSRKHFIHFDYVNTRGQGEKYRTRIFPTFVKNENEKKITNEEITRILRPYLEKINDKNANLVF